MPIKIKELVIKTNISSSNSGTQQSNPQQGMTEEDYFKIRDWIVEECMDEVNKLLEKRNLK